MDIKEKVKKAKNLNSVLSVNNLFVNIDIGSKEYDVLSDVSFEVEKNQILGLVGESGCGKSMTANAIMGYLRSNIKVSSGSILFSGKDLTKYNEIQYSKLRGNQISMIFQDSLSSLNPLMKVGKQIEEAYKLHYKMAGKKLKEKAIEALVNVGFIDAFDTYKKYPHQLSGGQRQRIMIAMAIACEPLLLIADEPTTALDVTTQNRILNLIKNIQKNNNMGIILISHDIKVIKQMCTKVGVMYAGKIVEYGNADSVISNPKHPYTKALIDSIPGSNNKNSKLNVIEGFVPSLDERDNDVCIFYDRCKRRCDNCRHSINTVTLDDNRKVMCSLYY